MLFFSPQQLESDDSQKRESKRAQESWGNSLAEDCKVVAASTHGGWRAGGLAALDKSVMAPAATVVLPLPE